MEKKIRQIKPMWILPNIVLVNGIFDNETDIINELDAKDVGEVFNEIIDDMKKTYE